MGIFLKGQRHFLWTVFAGCLIQLFFFACAQIADKNRMILIIENTAKPMIIIVNIRRFSLS